MHDLFINHAYSPIKQWVTIGQVYHFSLHLICHMISHKGMQRHRDDGAGKLQNVFPLARAYCW